MLTADGFDSAILGTTTSLEGDEVMVYSVTECLNVLMERDGMSAGDAAEFFDFNVAGAYVGNLTPIFVWDYIES